MGISMDLAFDLSAYLLRHPELQLRRILRMADLVTKRMVLLVN